MTNYEYIKSLSVEEFARFMALTAEITVNECHCTNLKPEEIIAGWLKGENVPKQSR